jgi:hypothetical protein
MADPHDWRLERLAQGELDEESARALERELGTETIKERLAQLRASNQEILARLPPATVAASIRRRLRPRRARWLVVALPLALAGAAAVVLAPRPQETVRIKGASHLYAYQAGARGDRPVRLAPGARVRPHDALQLAYTAGEARFGMVISVDGRGVVTQHLPASHGGAAPPLATNGETSLPVSYELDDAPEFERFFFVTAVQPFGVDQVVQAARTLARSTSEARHQPLPLPPDLAQESLLLEKARP